MALKLGDLDRSPPKRSDLSEKYLEEFFAAKKRPISNSVPVTDTIREQVLAHFLRVFGSQEFEGRILKDFEGQDRDLAEVLGTYTVPVNLKVYATINPDLIQALLGQRDSPPGNVFSIVQGLDDDGYHAQLAHLNGQLQAVDGKTRNPAFDFYSKHTGQIVPYYFFIAPESGTQEMISLNNNRTGWNARDYIVSHMVHQDTEIAEKYKRMYDIMEEFGVTAGALKGLLSTKNRGRLQQFQKGTAPFTLEKEQEVRDLLTRTKIIHSRLTGHKDTQSSDDGRTARTKQKKLTTGWINGVRLYLAKDGAVFINLRNAIQKRQAEWVNETRKRKQGKGTDILDLLLEICPLDT